MANAPSGERPRGEAAPLVLRGTPDDLVGVMELSNDTKESLLVRSLRLHRADFSASGRSGRRRLMLRGRVPAGERRRLPVQFAVDPSTPPGSYEAIFADDAGEHAARIEILPQQRLGLIPDRIEIEAAPGEVVTTPVVLSNEGNVPLELTTLGVMVLEENQQICLALQHALGEAKGKGYEAFLDALTQFLAAKKVDFLRLRLAGGGVKLGVNETANANLELHVPANAQPGRTYQARTSVLDEPLFLKLRTRGATAATRTGASRSKGESR